MRILIAFVASAVLLAATLSAATLVTVRRFLEDQRVRSSTRQTYFALLFAREFLASRPDPEALVSNLQIRQSFDAMVTEGADWYSTRLDLTPESVAGDLRGLVASESVGYRFQRIGANRQVVFGAPLPPPRTDLYLFFSLDDIDRTLSILGRVMAVLGLAAVVIVVFVARRVTDRILHPLGAVSRATQRIAEGLLETRVEEVSADELGQLAASFNRMTRTLRSMIDRERMFVAAVSHELRTPLAALNASSRVVTAYRDRLPADGQEALDMIGEDLRALRQLVEELMEISELDAGRATVRSEAISVRGVCDALLARRGRDVWIEGDDIVVETDKARLERVIANLVDNAYTHGEGRDVGIRIGRDGEMCILAVSDRGPGIDSVDLPHVFERFYKSDRSRARDRGGVGLGLALAYENAHVLGASLDVASGQPGGTTFTLRLPLGRPEGAL